MMEIDIATYLSTSNLCIGYRAGKQKHLLFNNLNLHLRAGELVCFMGPNGIGKSSLIRTLGGLQQRLSGDIYVLNQLREEVNPHQISLVLTDKIIGGNLTVNEMITFGRYPYLHWNVALSKKDLDIIQSAVHQLHLEKLVNRKIYELSDGQMQMVMIARALAQDTPIILLDEPTAHLDLNNRIEIMNLLRKLSRSTNKAILVATHELDLALQTADRIWLTSLEQNIMTGVPEDLVLNGAFDEIFKFKGFDLKTGKVQHEAYRGKSIQLTGEGPEYLWTKNSLERSGYETTHDARRLSVNLTTENGRIIWKLSCEEEVILNSSLRDLLNSIESIDCDKHS